MTRKSTTSTRRGNQTRDTNGDVKQAIRAAGERDFAPADSRVGKDAGGADLVRAAESIGLFRGVGESDYESASGRKPRRRKAEDDNGVPERDPWLKDQLALLNGKSGLRRATEPLQSAARRRG